MAYELIATTDYVRGHEIFIIRVDMSDYLLEYYTHRQTYAPDTSSEHDEKLKVLIACFAIHLSARTTLETHAWTVQMVSEPPFSLFVTGSTGELDDEGIARGFLVGHVLQDSIRHSDTNGIHAQYSSRGQTFKSYVKCESSDMVELAEAFYRQSEQRPLRILISPDSDTALGIAALPGYDPEWFTGVDINELASSKDLDSARMRNCRFSFRCDCSPERLMPFLRALSAQELDEIYGSDEQITISCPRCGKRFRIDRSMVSIT